MGEAAKPLLFEGFQAGCHVVLRGRRSTLWHSKLFDNVSKMSKLEEVSHEMLVFMPPRVSCRVSGFPVASPCLWGKPQNLSFSKVSDAGCRVVLRGRRSTLWHSNLFDYLSKMSKLEEVSHEMLIFLRPHVSRLESLVFLWHCRVYGGSSALHTLHFTLHTPHFTLYTPHSTLHTLQIRFDQLLNWEDSVFVVNLHDFGRVLPH